MNDSKHALLLIIGIVCLIQLVSAQNYGIGYYGIGYYGIGDNVSPSWVIEPENQSLPVNTPLSYLIEASDDSGIANYTINDASNFSIGLLTGLLTNNTGLIENTTYYLNITATDNLGNTLWKVITITITSPTPTPVTSGIPVIVRPIIDGVINKYTTFLYRFAYANDSQCDDIISETSVNITTDKYGVGFAGINVTLSYAPQYLCEYRDGIGRIVHTISDETVKKLYLSDNIYLDNGSSGWTGTCSGDLIVRKGIIIGCD